MRGEETVHTDLQLNQFGIVALTGGMLRHPHFEVMRFGIGKSFLLIFDFLSHGTGYLRSGFFFSYSTRIQYCRQMSWKNALITSPAVIICLQFSNW